MFAPAIGDLNGDGNPDLVIPAFSNGDVIPSGAYVLLGEANGTFLPATLLPVGVLFGAVLLILMAMANWTWRSPTAETTTSRCC